MLFRSRTGDGRQEDALEARGAGIRTFVLMPAPHSFAPLLTARRVGNGRAKGQRQLHGRTLSRQTDSHKFAAVRLSYRPSNGQSETRPLMIGARPGILATIIAVKYPLTGILVEPGSGITDPDDKMIRRGDADPDLSTLRCMAHGIRKQIAQ